MSLVILKDQKVLDSIGIVNALKSLNLEMLCFWKMKLPLGELSLKIPLMK